LNVAYIPYHHDHMAGKAVAKLVWPMFTTCKMLCAHYALAHYSISVPLDQLSAHLQGCRFSAHLAAHYALGNSRTPHWSQLISPQALYTRVQLVAPASPSLVTYAQFPGSVGGGNTVHCRASDHSRPSQPQVAVHAYYGLPKSCRDHSHSSHCNSQ
jgi:hypothetical protein